jgi:hypothetical protein
MYSKTKNEAIDNGETEERLKPIGNDIPESLSRNLISKCIVEIGNISGPEFF